MEIEATVIPLPEDVVAYRAEWEANAFQREYDAVTRIRQQQYRELSDPIFMQYQRGEATKEQWLAAVQAVKDANPYPVKEEK